MRPIEFLGSKPPKKNHHCELLLELEPYVGFRGTGRIYGIGRIYGLTEIALKIGVHRFASAFSLALVRLQSVGARFFLLQSRVTVAHSSTAACITADMLTHAHLANSGFKAG